MDKRKTTPRMVETSVLMASGRKCCLCVFLDRRDEVRLRGQIAHLNHDPRDWRFENLVYLCLEHHDHFDGKTSQSKGLTAGEVRAYREQLYARIDPQGKWRAQSSAALTDPVEEPSVGLFSDYELVRKNFPDKLTYTAKPWRSVFGPTANEPEFFAYKAGNRCDGVCLIERINLPDGRVVVACTQTAGNPGQSITNCVEELCFQVCERFKVPADKLIWLEHYDFNPWDDWSMVTFGQIPPHGPFDDPKWVDMTPGLWRKLRLKPKRRLKSEGSDLDSNLTKLFPWTTENLH